MNSLRWNLENSYRTLPDKFFDKGEHAAFPKPTLRLFNHPLARELGLLADHETINLNDSHIAALFAGNTFPPNAKPIAQAYAGHQFGHFNMLGDGRATLLGEQITPEGKHIDIQLKGNGRTRYSRRGDGKAALAPMLREYLISEAMHALGIPTTRSLALVTTGEDVYRESALAGAVLTRTADSHIRVATFQFAAAFGDSSDVKALADYAIARHFPEILNDTIKNPYLALLEQIIARQAKLIAKWQLVGFIHGVMNTDNMAISGETIDYGPCAFMDSYDSQTVFSSIDRQGRYRYENQPVIAQWNLARLAETLLPLLSEDTDEAITNAKNALAQFQPEFEQYYQYGLAQKLGIANPTQDDHNLAQQLLRLMYLHQADYTHVFARLTLEIQGKIGNDLKGTDALFTSSRFAQWRSQWQTRLTQQSIEETTTVMQTANPMVIPRNSLVEHALEQATIGNFQPFEQLFHVLQQPYTNNVDRAYQNVPFTDSQYQTFCGT